MNFKKEPGLLSSNDLKTRKYIALYTFFYLIIILSVVACFSPILWVFLSAFKDTSEFLRVPPTIFPESFQIGKLKEVWQLLDFGRYYLNSLILVAGSLGMTLFLNGIAGYFLALIKPRGYVLVFILMFWTMLMPKMANLVPLYMSFVDVPVFHVNITNSYLPSWLMAGANAFYVLMFKNYFSGIPKAYVEAAKLDGCSNLGIFFRIIVPMSKPIISVVSIFSIQESWGDFFWPSLIVTDPEKYPVAVMLYRLQEANLTEDKYMMVLFLAIIPVLILFLIFSKNIINGANMSGVKE